MRLAVGLLGLLILVSSMFSQDKTDYSEQLNSKLEFGGKTVSVDIDKTRSLVVANIKFYLSNTGRTPLIILSSRPACERVAIAKNIEDLDRSKSFLYPLPQSSRFVDESQWLESKIVMDQDRPPEGKTVTIAPGMSISYSDKVSIRFPDPSTGAILPNNLNQRNLDELRLMSPVYARLERCSLLGESIDPSLRGQQRDFYKRIQSRWGKYGHLLLADVLSEPFLLDLTSSTTKY